MTAPTRPRRGAAGDAAGQRPFVLDDIPRLVGVREVALSPDGSRVAVTLETSDERANRRRRRIVVLEVDLPARRRTVARGGAKLGHPAWAPDGSCLAYVADRAKASQIEILDLAGGPPSRLTHHPAGAGAPAWSPDGRSIAFVADGAERAGDGVPVEEKDPRRRVIRVRGHRHRAEGSGFLGAARPHVWVVETDSGRARQLTDGPAEDGQVAWSPDGHSIAFVSDRSPGRDRHFGGGAIHVVDVGSGAVRRVSPEGRSAALPSWSPDGGRIAYLRSESASEIDGHIERLWVADVASGAEACWTSAVDQPIGFRPGGYRTASPPAWSPDGTSIVQILSDGGRTQLARFSATAPEPLTEGDHVLLDFSANAAATRIVFIGTDPRTPPELWTWEAASGVRRLAGFNDALLEELDFGRIRHLQVERSDGFRIDAWLTLPPGEGADRAPTSPHAGRSRHGGRPGSLPLVLMIHGGPHNAFGEAFAPDVELLAAAGFAVLRANPRGSGGYAESFTRAVVGDWAGADFEDLLAAVDAALGPPPAAPGPDGAGPDAPALDSARLGIMGGSYGGFMTCWAIGNSDRFVAAVAGAPLSNLESEYGTSDIGPSWFREELAGRPDENPDGFRSRSPLTWVNRVTAPLLLFHGEADLRVPIEQSEQFFAALTDRDRTVELLRVPGEGHVLPGDASPVHARIVREAIVEWFGRWLEPGRHAAGHERAGAQPPETPR